MKIDTDILWDKRYNDILNRSNGKVFKKQSRIKEYKSLYNITTSENDKLKSILDLKGIVKLNKKVFKDDKPIEVELDPISKYFKSNNYTFNLSELFGGYDIKDKHIEVEVINNTEESTYEIENDYIKIYTPNSGSIELKLICSSNTVIIRRDFSYYNTKEN